MRKEDLYKLIDSMEEIERINEIISHHKTMEDSGFMVDQYEAGKTKLISDLINESIYQRHKLASGLKSKNRRIIRYRTFKRHLEFFLDKVATDHSPVLVEMDSSRDVIVLSKTDYENMPGNFFSSGPDRVLVKAIEA